MGSNVRKPLIGLVLTCVLATVWVFTLKAAEPQQPDSGLLLTEYPIPYADSRPWRLHAIAPGTVWFTMSGASAIGLLQVTQAGSYTFTRYDTPTPNSQPYDLAYRDGEVWFTEYQANQVARLNVANGVITEFPLPTPDSRPTGIDVASGGDVWFVTESGDTVGYLDPATGVITEFSHDKFTNAQLSDVAVFNDSSIWVTAPGRGEIYNFVPAYNQVIPLFPGAGSLPTQVALEGNNPWITENGNRRIGRYAPGTLTFWRWYEINSNNVILAGIAYRSVGNNRQVWFTEQNTNRVGQLIVDGDTGYVTRFWRQALPTVSSEPIGIDVDADGTAWITESQGNAIAAWRDPYYDLPAAVFSPVFTND